jgi:feruloyl-CoA synthase
VRDTIHAQITAYNRDHPAGSTRIARALLLTEPLSLDAGEITDKGSVNQRGVLARRSALVEGLYNGTTEFLDFN